MPLSIVIFPLAVAVAFMLSASAYGFSRRDVPGSVQLGWLMLAQALWIFCYIMDLASRELETKIFWLTVKYVGSCASVWLWMVLCFELTENTHKLTRAFYTVAIGWYVLVVGIVMTNDWHHLFWINIFAPPDRLESLTVHGPLFILYSLPSTAVVPASIIFFVIHSRTAIFYRNRSFLLILSALLPVIFALLGVFDIFVAKELDQVTWGSAASGVIIAIAVLRFRVLDVLRVAKDLIIENINAGVLVVDHRRKLLGLNPHAEAQFPSAEIGTMLDIAIPEIQQRQLIDGDEWELKLGSGSGSGSGSAEIFYLVRISEVANKRVGKLGFALILLDISVRKAAEKAISDSLEAKNRFFANVSHELRTPLHGISGLLELLKRTELNEQQTEYLGKASASAQLLQTLINDVLDISRIESEQLAFELVPFALPELVENVASVVGVDAHSKGIELLFHTSPIEKLIIGDSLRLTQVLTNLAANAVKFTKEGWVKIAAQTDLLGENRVAITFVVSDSGMGIPENRRTSLFDAFSQVDTSTTRQFGGTGLGLAISKQLVNRMGGDITVESEEGKGSSFSFTLEFELGGEYIHEEIFRAEPPPNLAGLNVLVVDDSSINQQVAAELLEQAGVAVQLASNGKEAIHAVSARIFDVILMDIHMPEMDGHTATRVLRHDFPATELPIIAMTASAFEEDRKLAADAGMTDFVVKPFQPSELYSVIERAVFSRDATEELPVFEADGAARIFNGNEALYTKLLKQLGEETAAKLSAAGESVSREELEEILHKIKGSAGMIGATELAACATRIAEEIITTAQPDIPNYLAQLKRATHRLSQAV